MQKKSLLQFWLLLCLMIAGATHAWADEIIWTASGAGYNNQDAITKVNLDANITATFDKGTNNSNVPKYYTTGTAVRCYGGNTFTISSETATITKIELTFGSGDGSNAITTDKETYSDGTWEGSAESITFTIGGTSGNRRIAGITVTYTTGGSVTIPTHTVTWSVNGQTSTTPDVNEGAAIVFPKNPDAVNGKEFVGWSATAIDGVIDDAPEMVTEATMGQSDITFYAVFADLIKGTGKNFTDVLTTSTFGSPSTYTSWSGKKATNGSDAVYAGNSTTNAGNIQIRATSPSGIVTTKSGGKAKKVTVSWASNTTAGRTLDVYGKDEAYEAADLYGDATGNLIGSIVYGTGTELTISGDYEYIGLRSNSGAMYLENISIDWTTGTPDTYSGYCTTVAADPRAEAGISFAEAEVTKEIVENYTGQELTNPKELEVTWTSSNEDVATVENGTVTVKAVGETTITATFAGNKTYKAGSASYTLIIQDSRIEINPEFAATSVSVNVKETVNAPALSGNTGEAAVTYESSDPTIATVDEQGVVTGVADGEATITATIAATNQYQGGTATFTVTVIDPNKKGTQTNPYTVAEAIENTPASGKSETVYIKGVVSAFFAQDIVSDGSNYRYYISEDGTTENQLLVYKGKGLNNEAFSSADDLQIGDEVVITGQLTTYNNEAEVAANNYIVSRSRKATPTLAFEQGSYTMDKETTQTITATTNSDAPIVYTSSDETVAVINESTGSVMAYAVGTTTITATVAETANYKGATVSVELNVIDSSIKHNVTFHVATEAEAVTETFVDGTELTLPDNPTVEGYAFAGWSTTNDVNAPEFVSTETVVEADMDLYAMFVAKAGETVYQLVESDQTDWRGNYLIAYSDGIFADGRKSGTDGIGAANASAIPGNNLKGKVVNAAWGDQYCVTLEAIDDNNISSGYLLKTKDGLYNYQSSNKNGIVASDNKETAQAYPITVNFKSSNDIELALGGNAEGAVFHYNPSGYFRFYKDGSQSPVYLYKKVTGTPIYFDGTIVDEVALSDAQDYIATTATVAKKVTLTRTVKANTWSSFVVPFNMAKPEGVDLKELSSSEIKEDGTLTLNFTEATAIEAGKPYMMRSDNEITKFSADDAVVLPAAQKQDAATTYVDMIGTYVTTNIPTGDYFFSNNVFKYVGAHAVNTKGFRAYFHLHDLPAAEGEARIVAFGLDDETTGIGGASHLNDKGEMINEVFDLSGRKVAQPTRGLYIVNGKKLFVK